MTKARTVAARRKAKRGRPCLPASHREPNGQPSRRKESQKMRAELTEQEARSVVVQRRIRHDNIVPFKRPKDGKVFTPEELATDPKRGYVLGLMFLDGKITEQQHDTGIRYAEAMARYYALSGVPFPSARAQNLFAVIRSTGDDENEERAKAALRARSKMVRMRDTLLSVGDIHTGRKVKHTVDCICVLDMPEARNWPNHMVLWLKQGLNKLANDGVV